MWNFDYKIYHKKTNQLTKLATKIHKNQWNPVIKQLNPDYYMAQAIIYQSNSESEPKQIPPENHKYTERH